MNTNQNKQLNLLEHSLWTLPQGYNFTFDQSRCAPGRRLGQKTFDTTWSRHGEWLSELRDFILTGAVATASQIPGTFND